MKVKKLKKWKNFMLDAIYAISNSDETPNYRNKAIVILTYLIFNMKEDETEISISSTDISNNLNISNSHLKRSIVLLEDLGFVKRVQDKGAGNRKIFIIPQLEEIYKD
ncbi:MAG: hypothetical protein OFPII_44020 [Osedax symbiont Rs1]|nr:MAG: hypothetical protein OFPII_44020 [Osedax symbiont Rs1]